jgi:hypothetical protein
MVARFLYRLASLCLLVSALAFWLLTARTVASQLVTGFRPEAFCGSIIAPLLACISHLASSEAWRAARHLHIHSD